LTTFFIIWDGIFLDSFLFFIFLFLYILKSLKIWDYKKKLSKFNLKNIFSNKNPKKGKGLDFLTQNFEVVGMAIQLVVIIRIEGVTTQTIAFIHSCLSSCTKDTLFNLMQLFLNFEDFLFFIFGCRYLPNL